MKKLLLAVLFLLSTNVFSQYEIPPISDNHGIDGGGAVLLDFFTTIFSDCHRAKNQKKRWQEEKRKCDGYERSKDKCSQYQQRVKNCNARDFGNPGEDCKFFRDQAARYCGDQQSLEYCNKESSDNECTPREDETQNNGSETVKQCIDRRLQEAEDEIAIECVEE